jgi:mono/diheme cytochrome c family protein
MYSRFYLSLLLISGLVLIAFLGIATYRELTPEWRKYQAEYKELLIKNAKDEAAKKKARSIKIGHQQIYIEELKKVDRCMNCHTGVDNPLMADTKVPFKQHSSIYLEKHPVNKFGCTVCHYGQGRATTKKEAHGKGRDTHWDYPIIPFQYIQSSCAQCHDYKFLEKHGGEMVVKGERLFREKGCKGCHKLTGVGGDLGKALDIVGSQPIAYFPMKHVVGEHTVYNWLKQHFIDPRRIVPGSEMRVFLTEEEADLLTTYTLTLRAGEIPRKYRRIRYTGSAPKDGESLYKMYCIACHATGKISAYDEILKRTIPAIMNPAFLRIADDKNLKKIIEEGRKGTPMTAWKKTAAGLSDYEISRIVEYLTDKRPEDKARPFDFKSFKADIKHGEKLYEVRCALCHGKDGKGGKDLLGLNLRNPTVQKIVDPEFLSITVRDGRSGTPMPAFGKDGVGLSDQDIVDVVTYIRSFPEKKPK